MRASPAFQVSLRHFGVWRLSVLVWVLVASSSALAWCASGSERKAAGVWLLALAVTVLMAWAAIAATRSPAMSLRWDTQTWRLGPVASLGEEPWSGQLAVLIDVGPWMLLRFSRDDGSRWSSLSSAQHWLAVQRGGLPCSWHSFRCAVLSSRPARLTPASGLLTDIE